MWSQLLHSGFFATMCVTDRLTSRLRKPPAVIRATVSVRPYLVFLTFFFFTAYYIASVVSSSLSDLKLGNILPLKTTPVLV